MFIAPVVDEPIRCFGSTTSVTAKVTGGTGPYTYSTSASGATVTASGVIVGLQASRSYVLVQFNGVGAGQYTFTATDSNGVVSTQTLVVPQPPSALVISAVGDLSSCEATTNVVVTASGGQSTATTRPLSVTVQGCVGQAVCDFDTAGVCGASQTIASGGGSTTFSGVGVGSYRYTVTDINGCSASTDIALSLPVLTIQHAVPLGRTTGFATIEVSGGVAPYTATYGTTTQAVADTNAWYGPFTTFSGLAVGDHTFTATDSTGCTASSTITISADVLKWFAPPSTSSIVNWNGAVSFCQAQGGSLASINQYCYGHTGASTLGNL